MTEKYSYELLNNEHDAQLCARLISDEFSAHNPFSVFNGNTSDEFFTIAWSLVHEVLEENLSWIVRDRKTNEIIATLITGDFFLYRQKHAKNHRLSFEKSPDEDLFRKLDDLFVENDFNEELKGNLVLQLVFTVVHHDHAGKGLAARLSAHGFDYAHQTKGFKYVFIQTSHPATENLYINKMNGRKLSFINPKCWQWENSEGQFVYPFEKYDGVSIQNILIDLETNKS